MRVHKACPRACYPRGGGPRRRRLDAATQRRRRDLTHGAVEPRSRHLTDPPDLAQLGQALDRSPVHLHRVFRASTGMPIHRYVLGLRLRTAIERLLGGARNLTELALYLGFADHRRPGQANAFRKIEILEAVPGSCSQTVRTSRHDVSSAIKLAFTHLSRLQSPLLHVQAGSVVP